MTAMPMPPRAIWPFAMPAYRARRCSPSLMPGRVSCFIYVPDGAGALRLNDRPPLLSRAFAAFIGPGRFFRPHLRELD